MTVLVCDVDHTLFDSRWRDELGRTGDWDSYNASAPGDRPVPEMVGLINALARDHSWTTICVTARAEKWRQMTVRQLLDHGVLYEELLMRPPEDFRPAPELKVALVIDRFGGVRHPVVVIDDREDVCAAFIEAGFTTLRAAVRRISRS